MAGVYKIGFPEGTPIAEAKEQAMAVVRDSDTDEVTAGPDILQAEAHVTAGEFLVRIVTGVEDPAVVAARERAAAAVSASESDGVILRLTSLPPAKIRALSALLDQL